MPNEALMTLPQELLILGAAVKSGIIELLRTTGATGAEIAVRLNLDRRASWTILEALADLGYLTRQADSFILSERTRSMLYDPRSPEYLGFSFMHRYEMLRGWAQLPAILTSGRPAVRDPDPESTRYFMEAMRYGAEKSAPAVADFLFPRGASGTRVLDIGGGPLIYGGEFAARGAKVTVLDLASVVTLMGEKARQLGIVMIAGDFNDDLPPGPFETAFLGNVCHIFGEVENRRLFTRVGESLAPGGRIVIIDMIRGTYPSASLFGVNMLVNTVNGGTWTMEQYGAWLGDSGFTTIRLDEAGGRQIVTALRRA